MDALTERRYGDIVKDRDDDDGLGPASALEDVEDGNEEGEEGACTRLAMRSKSMRRSTH